jgi:hypothetical protein
MLRPSYKNVVFCIILKFILFLWILGIKRNDYRLMSFHLDTLIYYLVIVFPIILIDIVLFSAPIYFAFKVKNFFLFALAIVILLIIDSCLYVVGTSYSVNDRNGIIYFTISSWALIFFFYKTIASKYELFSNDKE